VLVTSSIPFFKSGDVGMPQDLTAILNNDTATAGPCEVQVGWRAHSGIAYYTVFINGENVSDIINNGNQSLILRSYPVCSCIENQVSVIGVDRCGNQVQTALTTAIQLDQESVPPPMCETEITTVTQSSNNDENRFESKKPMNVNLWRNERYTHQNNSYFSL
jgi:hypothetical protein